LAHSRSTSPRPVAIEHESDGNHQNNNHHHQQQQQNNNHHQQQQQQNHNNNHQQQQQQNHNNNHQQQNSNNTPNHSSHIVNSNISSQERTLYITFFCLTTTFLLCHLPRILLNIYEVPMSQDRELCRQVYKRPFYSPRWVLVRITFTFSSLKKLR
jgi:hypothetical protein